MRAAADPQVLEQLGVAATSTAVRRVKSLYQKTDKRITRRDEAMRSKNIKREASRPTDLDIPLEGL